MYKIDCFVYESKSRDFYQSEIQATSTYSNLYMSHPWVRSFIYGLLTIVYPILFIVCKYYTRGAGFKKLWSEESLRKLVFFPLIFVIYRQI